MTSSQQLIELERRFRQVSKDTAPEPEVRSWWFPAPTIAWSDLLLKPCVVVLGEAGAGKTSEFRRTADRLRSEGKAAFFLPIEAVGVGGVEKNLDIGAAQTFRAWRDQGTSEVWLLLDSVDESKLKGRPLSMAVNALSHELEPHLGRIHLVLSSRASDWRSTDEEVVSKLLPHLAPSAEETATSGFIFCLAPLPGAQVARLAAHHGLQRSEVTTFLEQVREANAWVFLERPWDVASMVRYWTKNRRLGSHRQIVSTDINEKLAERSERPTSVAMSAERAREGARKLALAAMLTQSSGFQLPDEPIDLNAGDPIVPSEVLRDWSPGEVQTLLSRGLFDEATYGRVRIHHRKATELLAAEELLALIERGLPRDDLDALLFRNSNGMDVVPAHLQPVVAWCSLESHEVRRKAITIVPEHLLDHGDPSGLPPDARRAALRAYMDQFGTQEHVFHSFDPFGLKRFACRELTATLQEALAVASAPDHVRVLLLELVECGELKELAALARDIALTATTPVRVRIAAIEAAAKVGTEEDRAALLGLIATVAIAERNVAATLLTHLFPDHMPDSSLHALIRDVPQPGHRGHDRLEDILSADFAERCPPNRQIALLTALTGMLRGVSRDGKPFVSPRRFWLMNLFANLLATHVTNPALTNDVRENALGIIELCLEEPEYYAEYSTDMLHKSEALRAALLWKRAAAHERKEGHFPRSVYGVLPHWISLLAEDEHWLRVDAVERPRVVERLLAFHGLTIAIARKNEPDDAYWETLRTIASDSDKRHSDKPLGRRLSRMQARPSNPPEYLQQARYRLMRKARDLRVQRQRASIHVQVRNDMTRIREGTHWLGFFFDNCRAEGSTTRSDRVSIAAIAEMFDAEVAEAARLGFVTFWRRTQAVPVESHPDRTIPSSCILGLVGLALDEEQGTDISQLDDALLRRAVAYAPWEMNGFPPWLERCAVLRPDVVRDVFAPGLRQDFARPNENLEDNGHVLWKLAHEPLAIRRACAPVLVLLLMEQDPPRFSMLRDVLNTLEEAELLPEATRVALADQRLRSLEGNFERFALWWGQLVSYAPREAVRRLVEVAGRSGDPKGLVEAALARLTHEYDAQHREGLEPLRQDARALGELYELAVRYVEPKDDLVHAAGTAYTPIPRDDAQDGRNRLVNWLSAIQDSSATAELVRLSGSDALGERERSWVRHLAKSHAVLDMSKPAQLSDVTKLLHQLVVEPSTTAGLFRIALNRLSDFQFNLAHADFSVRDAYNPTEKPIEEEHVQHLLAKELLEKQRGQYVVTREPEVATKKKPDIRLGNPRCDGPVTIEAKIAERWTVAQLEDALATQLVGQYMRDNTSNYGIFVLCSSGPKPLRRWQLPDGTRPSFAQLAAHLAKRAAAILETTATIRGLVVFPIDFHAPAS